MDRVRTKSLLYLNIVRFDRTHDKGVHELMLMFAWRHYDLERPLLSSLTLVAHSEAVRS